MRAWELSHAVIPNPAFLESYSHIFVKPDINYIKIYDSDAQQLWNGQTRGLGTKIEAFLLVFFGAILYR